MQVKVDEISPSALFLSENLLSAKLCCLIIITRGMLAIDSGN